MEDIQYSRSCALIKIKTYHLYNESLGTEGQKEIKIENYLRTWFQHICLHAIGNIIIVDDAKVTETDVEINFLIEEDRTGQRSN